MKVKQIIIAGTLLVSVATFAQKDELKTLKKIYDKETPSEKDVNEFKSAISKAEPLISNATEADKVYFNYYKANVPFLELTQAITKPENKTNPTLFMNYFSVENIKSLIVNMNNVKDFEKKFGKEILTKDIEDGTKEIIPMLVNYAVALGEKEKYKESSAVLKCVYDLNKKDTDKLYYAAVYASNGKDFDTAVTYYKELITLNYSGETTNYIAFNKETKKDDTFGSSNERDLYVKAGTHEKPRTEKTPSKRPDILKNIAYILIQENNPKEEVLKALEDAKIANPNDATLILTEADYYYNLKNYDMYIKIISQALDKKPNDPELTFNLGVANRKINKNAEAEAYFKKAIAADSNYTNAYLNLAELKLSADSKFVEEINKLTTSEKDNKRYAVLKAEREKMFKETLPYLEKAYQLDPKNDDVKVTLLSVYKALEMTDKVKELKSK